MYFVGALIALSQFLYHVDFKDKKESIFLFLKVFIANLYDEICRQDLFESQLNVMYRLSNTCNSSTDFAKLLTYIYVPLRTWVNSGRRSVSMFMQSLLVSRNISFKTGARIFLTYC